MKITKDIAKRIKAAVREVCGGRRSVELGDRHTPTDQLTVNFLLWDEEADLQDTRPVDSLIGSEVRDHKGYIALDCYCYNLPLFGREPDDALDTNCYLLLSPTGEVVYASSDDLGHTRAINEILNSGKTENQ